MATAEPKTVMLRRVFGTRGAPTQHSGRLAIISCKSARRDYLKTIINKTKHLTLNSQTWHTVKQTVCETFRTRPPRQKLPVVPGVAVTVVPLHRQARTVRRPEPHDWPLGHMMIISPQSSLTGRLSWAANWTTTLSFITLFYSLLPFIISTESDQLDLPIIIIKIIKIIIIRSKAELIIVRRTRIL